MNVSKSKVEALLVLRSKEFFAEYEYRGEVFMGTSFYGATHRTIMEPKIPVNKIAAASPFIVADYGAVLWSYFDIDWYMKIYDLYEIKYTFHFTPFSIVFGGVNL